MRLEPKTGEPCRPGFGGAYHIDWNATQDRWDVTDVDGRVHGHASDLQHAKDLAIREANTDHSAGYDAVVCVQQDDGTYTMVWSSR